MASFGCLFQPSSLHPTEGFDDTRLEEYVRFQPYIRINKVHRKNRKLPVEFCSQDRFYY